ncbi:TPA: transposon-encoded TnpW family protein [Streptococcus agalactiae]|jgi:hypothetical protein|nr:transposon-encoded TnpW family protein [Streptococcus agalactiae]
MAENTNTQVNETHEEEQEESQKPDGVLTKNINGKTFVTEIYFDKKSKETFQDKLFKVIQSKGNSSE